MSTTTRTIVPERAGGRLRRRLTRLAALVVALALIAYLAVATIAASVLTTPRRALGPQTPATVGLAYQSVTLPARGDRVPIAGWFVPGDTSRRALVLVHGKDNSRTGWLSNEWTPFVPALHQRGFAVLLIDLRGHGQSGDAHYSFGINEQRDVEGAVDWLKGQGFQPGHIGVLGVSMGAASSILATADDPDIGALVADCSYAEIMPIIQKEWRGTSGLPDAVLPGTVLMSRLLFGANIPDARPVAAVGQIAPRPVLIIHGTADKLIPVAASDQLKAADPAAELWQVPGAAHGESFKTQPRAYTERVIAFFERNLK